jgi:hypothetical protein
MTDERASELARELEALTTQPDLDLRRLLEIEAEFASDVRFVQVCEDLTRLGQVAVLGQLAGRCCEQLGPVLPSFLHGPKPGGPAPAPRAVAESAGERQAALVRE